MESKKEEKIGEALLKVALGYQIAEVTEEYAEVDGALKLTKRKKTKKNVPPDLKAVQMLLENSGGSAEYSAWSDEDLEKEKARLLQALESGLQEQRAGDVSKTTEKSAKEANAAKKSVTAKAVKKETKTVRKKSVVKKTAVKKKTTK